MSKPTTETLSRRDFLQYGLVLPIVIANGLRPDAAIADTRTERNKLVEAMDPAIVKASTSFKEARRYEMGLNTTDYKEEAQDIYDLAWFETFRTMHENIPLIESEKYADSVLAKGKVLKGTDPEEFAEKMQTLPDNELAIPISYYKKGAKDRFDVSKGSFDPRERSEILFVEDEGLFDVLSLPDGQQYIGFTPRLAKGLRLDVYVQPHEYQDTQWYDANVARNLELTWSAHLAMSLMALTHGDRDLWGKYSENYRERLFDVAPYTVFPKLSSLMSGKPETEEGFWDSAGPFIFQAYTTPPLNSTTK